MVTFLNFSFSVLLFSYFYYYRKDFSNMIAEIFEKQSQIKECTDWCRNDGWLVSFNSEEKAHCISKCNMFSYTPPIYNYGCKMVCKPIDIYLAAKCSKSEFCVYYSEVNELSVKSGVELRWLKAVKNKVFGRR